MYKIFTTIQIVGKKLHYLPICHSTNDITSEMFKKGLIEEGDIVITDHQQRGRGQRDNQWVSEAHQNLTFSLLLRPVRLATTEHFFLNIITSVALLDVLSALSTPGFRIKWPNDIFFKELKLGGILIENSIFSQVIERSVIGIGLNVNQVHFPGPFEATSLRRIFQKEFNLNKIFNQIVERLDHRYEMLRRNQLEELMEDYLKKFYWFDEQRQFTDSEGVFEGRIRGIDEFGRLLIEVNGRIREYNHREVSFGG